MGLGHSIVLTFRSSYKTLELLQPNLLNDQYSGSLIMAICGLNFSPKSWHSPSLGNFPRFGTPATESFGCTPRLISM